MLINSPVVGIIEYAVAALVFIILFDYMFGWMERKVVAKAQFRHGPTYVGKFGILQNLADILKLLSKENIIPDNADRLVFPFAVPLLLAMLLFLVFILPLAPSHIASNLSLGELFVFVLLAFAPILLFLGGWTSGNKFGAISAQRSVLILLSYEIPMILVIATVALYANSYSLVSITNAQSSMYFALVMPIGLFVFFVVMLAEFERPPFDLREADSELIAGWLTDVSAPYYTLSLFVDYTRMLLGSALIAILFFGGWLGPVVPSALWLLVKIVIIAFFIVLIRIATVRMRIDRVLRLGWLWMLPLAILNLALTFILFIR